MLNLIVGTTLFTVVGAAAQANPAVTGDNMTPTVVAPAPAAASDSSQKSGAVVCFSEYVRLPQSAVDEFKADPAKLLTEYPTGGLDMSSRVRMLAGSSSETLDLIIGQLPKSNTEQVSAIGAGLARAAIVCARAAPEYAATIQTKVAEVGNKDLEVAFAAATGDFATAALGNAAGARGGLTAAAAIGNGGEAQGGGFLGDGYDGAAQTSETYSFTRGDSNFSNNTRDVVDSGN